MRYLSLLLIAALTTNCTVAKQPELVPAIIPSPSAEQLELLNTVLDQAMPGAGLSVNANAFNETSIVAFERAVKNDMDLTMPLRFQLLTDGENCFLSKMATEKRWKVKNLGCQRLSK